MAVENDSSLNAMVNESALVLLPIGAVRGIYSLPSTRTGGCHCVQCYSTGIGDTSMR